MAVMVAPPATVTGPARVPLEYGLGSVVAWRTGDRFESGIEWESQTCDPAGGRGGPACDPGTIPGLPKDFDSVPTHSEATSFVVYGNDTCSPFGGDGLEGSQQRALDHLLSREIQMVEYTVWTGVLGQTPNLRTATPILGGAAQKVNTGIAYLDYVIATQYGSQGVIHMTRGMALLGIDAGVLVTRGGKLFTELGTPVIAGTGYDGSGPTGSPALTVGQSWAYATPAMIGYRSEPFTAGGAAANFDRAQNKTHSIAERSYVVGWDNCGEVAVLLQAPQLTDAGPTSNPPVSLLMVLGSVPSSPIPDGTDTTIIVNTNIAPVAEVVLWYAVNDGAPVEAGEMTEVSTTQFVWNVQGDSTTTGDSVEVWAVSGAVESNHITIEVT